MRAFRSRSTRVGVPAGSGTLEQLDRHLCERAQEHGRSHPKRRPATAPRPSVWAALGNALLTVIGIYRY